MAFGSRGKASASNDGTVLVDLSEYDVPGDMTVIKIRTIRPTVPADLDSVSRAIASKSTVFVDLESFTGDTDAFVDSIKAVSRENSAHIVKLNTISLLVAPRSVEIRNQRIRRD